jgi:hypothetical protein
MARYMHYSLIVNTITRRNYHQIKDSAMEFLEGTLFF